MIKLRLHELSQYPKLNLNAAWYFKYILFTVSINIKNTLRMVILEINMLALPFSTYKEEIRLVV